MPTKILRTSKQYTATQGDPLHKTSEKVEVVKMPAEHGRVLGTPESQQNPAESKIPSFRPEPDPLPASKVHDWVKRTQEAEKPLDGAFTPPSRPHTVYEGARRPPPPEVRPHAQSNSGRYVHPYAYNPGSSVPFAAAATTERPTQDMDPMPGRNTEGARPESEALSRGVRAGRAHQDETASLGMGTFGVDASQDLGTKTAKTAGGSPRKPVPKMSHFPTAPGAASPSRAKVEHIRAQSLSPEEDRPRLHQPHHEHPFIPEVAARKQAEAAEEYQIQAMELARAEALAQLEAAQAAQDDEMARGAEKPKGPRQTFETGTSGPSFGWFADGRPIPRHLSMQPPSHAHASRDLAGLPFFRLPFGPPLPAPLRLIHEDGVGRVGLGLGVGLPLGSIIQGIMLERDMDGIDESPPGRRREDRSAYVETVEDDQEPTVADRRSAAPTVRTARSARSATPPALPAKPESTLQPETRWTSHKPLPRSTTPPPDFAPPRPASSRAPTQPRADTSVKMAPVPELLGGRSRAPTATAKAPAAGAPTVRDYGYKRATESAAARSRAPTARSYGTVQAETGAEDIVTQTCDPNAYMSGLEMPETEIAPTMAGHDFPHHDALSSNAFPAQQPPLTPTEVSAPSAAPTTVSNVKRIVAESKFHDETLCQLLDAARLNLIGQEAKKALNRAARARVIELKELRAKGEVEEVPPMPPLEPDRKKRSKSAEQGGKQAKSRVGSRGAGVDPAERDEPTTPPQWAQDIIIRLAAFDSRFSELEKQHKEMQPLTQQELDERTPPSQDIPSEVLNELLFHEMPSSGPHSGGGPLPWPFGPLAALGMPMPRGYADQHQLDAERRSAHIRTMTPTEPPATREGTARSLQPDPVGAARPTTLSWGSEVEMPQPGETVPPPKPPPTINVQPPTESRAASHRPITPSNASQAPLPRMPDRVEVVVIEEERSYQDPQPSAVPDPTEKNLPATPAESVQSQRPSPVSKSTPMIQGTLYNASTPRHAPSNHTYAPITQQGTRYTASPGSAMPAKPDLGGALPAARDANSPSFAAPKLPNHSDAHPSAHLSTLASPPHISHDPSAIGAQTVYRTAFSSFQGKGNNETAAHVDKLHIVDPINPPLPSPVPWDILTQRLYSWAMVWEEESFVRALETISLGHQIDEMPLTVFTTMTYKRLIRRNMSDEPPKACDKLFVPPTIADAISKAVHAKNFKLAQEMLEEMWAPLGFEDPPRVIIALSRHRNEHDQWAAHRFDLESHKLSSYIITHTEALSDGRPFMWWHAIRNAWPKYHIPNPDDYNNKLKQRVETVPTHPEQKNDNSLKALGYARNLLMGFRPERNIEVGQMRELIWHEVKRLLQKKRTGQLLVDHDKDL